MTKHKEFKKINWKSVDRNFKFDSQRFRTVTYFYFLNIKAFSRQSISFKLKLIFKSKIYTQNIILKQFKTLSFKGKTFTFGV